MEAASGSVWIAIVRMFSFLGCRNRLATYSGTVQEISNRVHTSQSSISSRRSRRGWPPTGSSGIPLRQEDAELHCSASPERGSTVKKPGERGVYPGRPQLGPYSSPEPLDSTTISGKGQDQRVSPHVGDAPCIIDSDQGHGLGVGSRQSLPSPRPPPLTGV